MQFMIAQFAIVVCSLILGAPPAEAQSRRPNIIYILADDLGYGELGCFGQTKIRTPNLDQMAAEGVRFTEHYSGSTVCAPSRCVLLTGKYTGHASVRDNFEIGGWGPDEPEGQLPLPDSDLTVAEILKTQGYGTAAVGKWGLGGPGSEGHPNRQGFDFFYGYLCQRVAHNYYPTHLWRNDQKESLGNDYFKAHQRLPQDADPDDPTSYAPYQGTVYAPDRMIDEALAYIRRSKDSPFFLYFASPVPHISLQVPDDSLDEYAGVFEESPYIGNRGYLPHLKPRSAYAAMITRFDRDCGRLLRLLDELDLAENTLVIFSSDNGTTFNGGTDAAFFDSVGGLRGLKCSLFEGGIRVPMIARWPGKIPAGTTSEHVSAFWDVLPTLCQVAGVECPAGLDGISLLPAMTGEGDQRSHEYLCWEYPSRHAKAVRLGRWKAVWSGIGTAKEADMLLFDLTVDRNEQKDVAAQHPDIVARILEILKLRTPSSVDRWNY